MKKYTPGVFTVDTDISHIELRGQLCPFLRACIGIAIVALAFTPGLYLILKYT